MTMIGYKKQKYTTDENEYIIDEEKFQAGNNFLRQDNELFDDESYKKHDIINAKRIELPNGGEDWEVQKNKETILTLKGVRFTKKERIFLRSIDGMMFIISGYKQGWRSVAEFKRQIKKIKK